ncbi:MAG: hypothetical protein J2P36_27400 [Ktedonobacteraceae bacterium]|nr:hypothetical protein [Ktedonobacteraceae bacterium]
MPRRRKDLDAEIAQHYYTAKEAQERLGMNRDKFNYIMKSRNIDRVPFLGGYGYFRKGDIDRIADEIEAFLLIGEKAHFSYRMATEDDLEAEIDLAALNFGRKRAELTREPRQAFLKANPQMTHYLFSHDIMVASMNLVPMTSEAIEEFRQGKRGWLFSIDQIEQFEPGKRLHCIIIDMMTTTRVTPEQRNRYAAYLLLNFGRFTLKEWAIRGVDIATVDACAGTLDGEKILKSAGFTYLGERQERRMYHLDIDQSELSLLKAYKSDLAKKR